MRRIALWDCSRVPKASFIGDYETAQETGSKFVLQNIPTAQFHTTSNGGVSIVKTLVKAVQSQRDDGCEPTAALPCPL